MHYTSDSKGADRFPPLKTLSTCGNSFGRTRRESEHGVRQTIIHSFPAHVPSSVSPEKKIDNKSTGGNRLRGNVGRKGSLAKLIRTVMNSFLFAD